MNPLPSLFIQHASSYNFPAKAGRAALFTSLIEAEVAERRRYGGEGPLRVLDVGCGEGIDGRRDYVASIALCCDELWGVEPDETVTPPPAVYSRVLRGDVKSANLPSEHFDVVYAYLVAEHVEEPTAFLSAIYRSLRPGGAFLLLTPNINHFFGRGTAWFQRLGLDEAILRRLRPNAELASYHYPVKYRMNSRSKLIRLAERAGFASASTLTLENPADTLPYFPFGTRFVWRLIVGSRRYLRLKGRLLHLVARFER